MGKRRVTPGTGQLNLEIESALLERLRDFVRDRDEKIRHVVEMAIRRHMDYPPPLPKPPEILPLPSITTSEARSSSSGKRFPKAKTTKKTK